MKIDIQHIASLAKLRIEEDKIATFEQQMQDIIAMVEQLPDLKDSLELDQTNPMELREDIVTPSMKRDMMLQIAPRVHAGCIVVPKTVE